jgi:predicted MPP superfamily phosphohydrolase
VRAFFSRISRGFVIFLAVFQLLLLYAWAVEPNWIEVTRHEVWFKNLPEEFDGLVVAHLSDLHMREYGARERRVLEKLAEAKPDVIAVTGDFTLEGSDPSAIRRFLEDLRKQKPAFGIWAVLGNHDHWYPPAAGDKAVRKFFSDAGVALLVNEWGRIGKNLDTLTMVGVDDPFTGSDNLGDALRGTQRTPFAILLTHSPQMFMKADLTKFDLVLTGHTHGGQVRLPGLGPLWLPAGSEGYDSGWFYGVNTQMYVTRGVGTSILPIRFLCRPEIALITLKRTVSKG